MQLAAKRVRAAEQREERCSDEQLRQRNMAMGYFLAKLFETMPTISKNNVMKLVGTKELRNIALGDKNTSKRENAKVNYDLKQVFEYVTKIKAAELF
jgi:hypothetical protein